jgi:hypothetical protein
MTSEERSTSRFSDWAIGIGHLAKELEKQKLPKISDATLSWLRSPKAYDLNRIEDAIPKLEAALITAKKLLARARQTRGNGRDDTAVTATSHGVREVGA